MNLPYNLNDKSSIVEYAKLLKGKTLRGVCEQEIESHGYSGKGNFGQILEKFYFKYEPNSDSEPDFKIAKLELKSSPLKKLKNSQYRSKERLVLNIINYLDIVHQDFYTSSFWLKNSNILLVFYLHQKDVDVLDFVVRIVDEWTFSAIDLEIIKNDWQIIQKKVIEGKAHELSEGDTYYLGACTKGGKGGNPRQQPNNPSVQAKQRAYSLKSGYVNHIIASMAGVTSEVYGKLIPTVEEAKLITIEEKVIEKFAPLIGKTDKELVSDFNLVGLNVNAKNYHSSVAKRIINSVFNVPDGFKIEDYIEEFRKAEITVKTVRLKGNNLPSEDISFPTFEYTELVSQEWIDSDFRAALERKFLFIFFQYDDEELVLRGVKFWNMPYEDMNLVEKVWQKTKDVVLSGTIVSDIRQNSSGKETRKTNFPGKNFSRISHVRPHASDAEDTYPLPVTDQLTKSNKYTKHCFWLNSAYVRDEIYLKS